MLISFVIFNGENLTASWVDIQRLFGFGAIPLYSAEAGYYMRSFLVLLLIATIGSTPCISRGAEYLMKRFEKAVVVVKPVLLILLLVLSTAYLVDGSFNPFLYFRF